MIRRIILTAVTTIALAAPALAQTNTMSPMAPAKPAVTAPAKPAVTKTSAKATTVKSAPKAIVHKVSHKTPVKPAAVKKTTA
jgi:hypothetical protein